MALGYEDLNDHDALRHDPALQTAVGRDVDMSSASTLCRFENSVDAKSLWALSSVLVGVFFESRKKAPDEIILDFDATDDEVHGRQEGRFFHSYYKLKQWRGIAIRYAKNTASFLAAVHIRCIAIWGNLVGQDFY